MKLILTKDEIRAVVSKHIATEFGIDLTSKETALTFSEYDSREYCTITVTDIKVEKTAQEAQPEDEINLDDISNE